MKRLLLGAAALAALSTLAVGCASTLQYQEPAEGPRARVRFATTARANVLLIGYDDPGCLAGENEWMQLRNGVMVQPNKVVKRLGMPLASFKDNAMKEVYVDAGKPLNAMFIGSLVSGNAVMKCAVPIHQRLEAGKDYELVFAQNSGGCSAQLTGLTRDGEGNPVRTVLADLTNRLTAQNSSCFNEMKKTRWRF